MKRNTTDNRNLPAILMALGAGISFAFGGTVSQIVGQRGFSVGQILFTQYLCGVICLGLLVALRFKEPVSKKDARDLFLLGMVNAIPCYFYYLAIRMMSVAAGIAIQFQYVWIVMVFQCIADKVFPKKRMVISAVMIIIGSVLASGMADELLSGGNTISVMGVICALLCAVSYAVFLFGNGRVALGYNGVLRAFIEALGNFTAIAIVQLISGEMAGFDFVGSIPGCALLGLLMTVIPITFIAASSTKISGGLVAILTSSQLPAAAVVSHLILKEPLTLLMIIGSFIIVGAIALAQDQ